MPKKILIIEDNQVDYLSYQIFLSKYNFVIHIAESLEKAKQLMIDNNYDVFIIDNKLVDSDHGIEIIGKGGAIPDKCIILSANITEELINELTGFYKVDRGHIMNKPPEKDYFVQEVRKIADGKYRLDIFRSFKFSFKTILSILFMIIFSFIFIKQYTSFISNKTISDYFKNKDIYCENRFKDHKLDNYISKSTYIEKEVKVEETLIIIRQYDNYYYSILITSKDNFPKKIWIAGNDYIKQFDYNESTNIFTIIYNSLKKTREIIK